MEIECQRVKPRFSAAINMADTDHPEPPDPGKSGGLGGTKVKGSQVAFGELSAVCEKHL